MFLAAAAPAAHATIANVFPVDDGYDPIEGDTVLDYAGIQAYVTSPSGGIVCLHPAVPVGVVASCDDPGAWGKVPVGPFVADFIPLASGKLVPGDWIIVANEGSGGPETARSEAFSVAPCQLCAVQDYVKSTEFVAKQKQILDTLSTTCDLLSVANVLYQSREIYALSQVVYSFNTFGVVGSLAVTAATTGAATYISYATPPSFLPRAISWQIWGLCTALFGIPPFQRTGAAYWMKKWVDDPPDPDYATVDAPDFIDWSHTPGIPADDLGHIRTDTDHLVAYEHAALTAYERYQGAAEASDSAHLHAQSRAVADDLFGYSNSLDHAAQNLQAIAVQMRADFPDAADRTVTQSDIDTANAFTDRLRTTGFLDSELDQLHGLGLNDAQIAKLRDDLGRDLSGVTAGQQLDAAFDDLADSLVAAEPATEDFAREAAVAAGRTNQPPVASFETDAADLGPLTAHFTDTSTSPDLDPIGVDWDFGDGTTGSGPTASHAYLTAGTYTVTETVSDYLTSVTATKEVHVGEGKLLVDVVTNPATNDQAFSFSAAFPPNFFDVTSGHTESFYVPAGDYAVGASARSDYRLTGLACDDGSSPSPSVPNPDEASATYKVELGEVVKCTFTYRPLHDLSVNRDGSGNGNVTSTPAGVDCGSTCVGTFVDGDQVTLNATPDAGSRFSGWSGGGCSGTGNCVVTMDGAKDVTATFAPEPPPNQPPTAAFTATPDHGPGPVEVDVDASGSSDEDGSIADYHWNWGDGSSGTSAFASHAYDHAGTYTITLTVTDDQGASDSTTHDVAVESDAPPPNAPPTAAFSATPDSGAAPLTVSFDGSGSSDSDGTVAQYQWNFGDGTTDSSTGPATSHIYSLAGVYTATLLVKDDDDATSTAVTRDITVTGGPPQPQDDHLTAANTVDVDVLANDSDPDADPLQVVAIAAPEHGSADCSKLGACSYAGDPGYVGFDSFTYTVRDPDGHEATATVYLNVLAPPAFTGAPVGQDDDAVTRAGTSVDIPVLANDTGEGTLSVIEATDPQHGTVNCAGDGTCHYTPAYGFSGHDGFTYTLEDGNAQQSTADVHVVVAPAQGDFTVGMHGRPDSLAGGTDAHWGTRVGTTPAGLATDALAAFPAPAVTANLGGDQSLKTGSVRTAPGWNLDSASADKQQVTAHAGPHALLGEAVEQPLAKPLPPTSQGTGGDGHVPILVGSKVFAFFHHSFPTSVTCIDRTTGARCPGYPITLPFGTDNVPGPAAVVGPRIYVHLLLATGYAQSASLALFCWDTATDKSCGFVIVDRFRQTSSPTASAPVLVAGKIWFAGGPQGRLYCVDPDTNKACAVPSLPTGLVGGDGAPWDIVSHGSRVFVASRFWLDAVACVDVAAGSACPGWATPKTGLGSNLINRHAADGSTTGVCIVAGPNLSCIDDATPETVDSRTNWPTTGDDYNDVTLEAEAGTRTLFGSLNHAGLGCWNWTTMAPCTGTGTGFEDGWLAQDSQGNPLPSAYGAAWDGSCAVGLGDPGLVFTVDPRGTSPCASLAGTNRTIDLRDQRCDGGVGSATWAQVALADSAAGELNSVLVTVRDAQTGAVLKSGDIASGALGLSGIDPAAHPSLTVQATATSAGSGPWSDAIPPQIRVSWHGDPQQLCFDSATTEHCAPAATSISASAALAGMAAPATKQLAVTHTACPRQDAQQQGTTTTTTGGSGSSSPPSRPPADTAAEAVLGLVFSCTDKRVVLQDVYQDGGRVRLFGYAVTKYVGKKVTIVFAASGKAVATARVKSDGSFSATAPLPAAKLRNSTLARYQARIGSERSLNLKLVRRMLVTSLSAHSGKVTIKGRVTGPLAPKAKDRMITLQRVVACRRAQKVGTFQPRSDGSFRTTVSAPKGQRAAVYRLSTLVRVTGKSRLARTYTLPRAVAFG